MSYFPGGGSSTWGSITGTLSSQTDLNTALSGKQPLAAVLTGTTASFTTALDTKLAGIAAGATANSADAFLLSRTNHTGTQAASTITGLAAVATSGSAADLSAGTLLAARMPALTGDVTSTVGTVGTTIANSAVTLAKMADVATGSVFYRKTAGTGAPEVQTLATLKTDLGLTGTNSGDQTITLTGDVTGTGTGSFAATIAAGVVTNAKLANVATATFKGRTTAGTGSPEDLTGTQATALLDAFSSTLKGLAPASGGGTSNFLRADGTWAAPAGGGGANGRHFQLPYPTGTFVVPMLDAGGLGTIALANGLAYAYPFIPARNTTINELAIEVSTLTAGTAHAGIYTDTGAMYPNAKVIGTVTGFNTGATGVKTEVIASTTLNAGTLYWMVVYGNAAATLRAIPVGSCLPIGYSSTGGSTVFNVWRANYTFAAPPATFPTAGATALSQAAPLARFKIA